MNINHKALDRYITGNYGEDQFKGCCDCDEDDCDCPELPQQEVNDFPPEDEDEEVIISLPPEAVQEAVDKILGKQTP